MRICAVCLSFSAISINQTIKTITAVSRPLCSVCLKNFHFRTPSSWICQGTKCLSFRLISSKQFAAVVLAPISPLHSSTTFNWENGATLNHPSIRDKLTKQQHRKRPRVTCVYFSGIREHILLTERLKATRKWTTAQGGDCGVKYLRWSSKLMLACFGFDENHPKGKVRNSSAPIQTFTQSKLSHVRTNLRKVISSVVRISA